MATRKLTLSERMANIEATARRLATPDVVAAADNQESDTTYHSWSADRADCPKCQAETNS